MTTNSLTAITPIDGRYYGKVSALSQYFSEEALMRYRIHVEVEYLIALADYLPPLHLLRTREMQEPLRRIVTNFDSEAAQAVKDIERITNHDVKAIEYYIKSQMKDEAFAPILEFVHFGLTSQDINNTAQPLALKEAVAEVLLPKLKEVIDRITLKATEWRKVPMLARTHGQPASPTTVGKEFRVFEYRLVEQLRLLQQVPQSVKFGGATGNMNAHYVSYPEIDWRAFARHFAQDCLGMQLEEYTTQISNYDNLAALMDALKRICVVLVDFARDIWLYIANDYFKQKIKEGEVGSSAMPHKVNPIDFENAEGNLGLAIALYEHLAHKLPISRLQRDLTDSTVCRNIGLPIAYMLIALDSLGRGLDKLLLNEEAIQSDLDGALPVVAEAIQTILRREGYPQPYETLKKLTRNNEKLTRERLNLFIDSLDISEELKAELKEITPSNYLGCY